MHWATTYGSRIFPVLDLLIFPLSVLRVILFDHVPTSFMEDVVMSEDIPLNATQSLSSLDTNDMVLISLYERCGISTVEPYFYMHD